MPTISPSDIPVRPDGLQINEHRGFQLRFWRAERIAWGAFALIALAALLGLFGESGPLNGRMLRFDSAEVTLPRILRAGSARDTLLTFRTPGPHEVAAPCAAVAQGLTVETPGQGWDGGCGIAVVAGSPEADPDHVVLRLTAERAGFARLLLRVDGVERGATFIVLP